MSQAKVDRYKEDKKNRQQIIKKQKREWFLTKAGLAVVAAVVVCWAGVSVYNGFSADKAADLPSYYVDINSITCHLIIFRPENRIIEHFS